MTVGLSASGKTTFAKQLCASNKNFRRVNKDLLREMRIGEEKFTGAKERDVLIMRDLIISNYLSRGLSVVVDDTNLNPIHETTLRKIAEEYSAEFRVESFLHVPYEECVRRDLLRDRPVGEQVIRKQWLSTLPKTRIPSGIKPTCVLVDVDGTVASMKGRSPFSLKEDEVYTAAPIPHVCAVVKSLAQTNHIVFLSGRSAALWNTTYAWLRYKAEFNFEFSLFMRPEADNRKDSIVKRELFEEYVEPYYGVTAVLDDRNQVVRMWRELGLPVMDVGTGLEF